MNRRTRTCAVIGAGDMGTPIAIRLMTLGHSVIVCDRKADKLQALAERGATTSTSVSGCTHAEDVLVLVATEAQVREIAVELSTAPSFPGTRHLAIMSTVSVSAVRDVETLLAPIGMRVVDAPVSGGADRARTGKLTIMVGGAQADVDAMGPVLNALAENIFHLGAIGAGQAAKIVNNILCHASTTLAAEAFRLGQTLGLKQSDLAQIMEVSTGRNYLTTDASRIVSDFTHHTADRAVFNGLLAILKKDLAIAAELAGSAGDYPMINGVAQLVGGLGDETFETWQAIAQGDTL